jgi:uncharacterized protein
LALTVYLDTSFLAGLLIEGDVFADRAKTFFADTGETLVVSDFAAAEFSSVVARINRMTTITSDQARTIFAGFDVWRGRFADEVDVAPADIRVATTIVRRLDLNLRAPDAINLAIAMRLGASVATFDHRMAENARALGLAVAAI